MAAFLSIGNSDGLLIVLNAEKGPDTFNFPVHAADRNAQELRHAGALVRTTNVRARPSVVTPRWRPSHAQS